MIWFFMTTLKWLYDRMIRCKCDDLSWIYWVSILSFFLVYYDSVSQINNLLSILNRVNFLSLNSGILKLKILALTEVLYDILVDIPFLCMDTLNCLARHYGDSKIPLVKIELMINQFYFNSYLITYYIYEFYCRY